ncbi:MAG: CoA transferase [Burkholderiales bacterium]|nr:CoA transferase [Burkholderiales bacterium]
MAASRQLLSGVRIADFSWIGAGSYTTKMLADLGAEVIKIESSVYPDLLRTSRPFKDGKPGVNRSGYFADRNATKRSITINMKEPRGRDIARALIAKSDIVCNNFAPGVMDRWGVGYADIVALKPDIVFISMSMQGASGPEKDYIGYGMTMTALTGLQFLTGLPDRVPAGTGTNYPDHIPNPCHAAFVLVAALIHRKRTGQGQFIDLAQTEPTLALLGPALLDAAVNGHTQTRSGNAHECFAPHGVYPCKGNDRWIAIGVETDAQWQALIEVLGAPEVLGQPRWRSPLGRLHERGQLDELIGASTRAWDSDQLMRALQARAVPCGAVRDAHDVLHRDEQLAHRKHWIRLEHPEMGETIYNSEAFRFSDALVGPLRAAPRLGEHTLDICTSLLGMPVEEVERLAQQGVLK